ncbi:MAG: thiamine-phosphate kinase [Natronospirillum sp.]
MSTEFERIARWFLPLDQPAATPPPLLGNGDDALAVRTDQVQVMSIDASVSGTHFPAGASAEDVASKALRAALSDLAAMGARPWFYTLSVVVPTFFPETWWEEFGQALARENQLWQLPCLGGDTAAGELLVVTIQVHGLCERPLTRSQALSGDDVWVAGTLGGSGGGLKCLLGNRNSRNTAAQQALMDDFYRPVLPLALMAELSPIVNAAIDVSDGLLADLGHILEASHCGAKLALEHLPMTQALVSEFGVVAARELALSGGEDFAVCFTAPRAQREAIMTRADGLDTPVTRIGKITEISGCELTLKGLPYVRPDAHKQKGYDHFV